MQFTNIASAHLRGLTDCRNLAISVKFGVLSRASAVVGGVYQTVAFNSSHVWLAGLLGAAIATRWLTVFQYLFSASVSVAVNNSLSPMQKYSCPVMHVVNGPAERLAAVLLPPTTSFLGVRSRSVS